MTRGQTTKIIAVSPKKLGRRSGNIKSYSELPEATIPQVEDFFRHYKDRKPTKWVKIQEVGQVEVAKKMISDAIE